MTHQSPPQPLVSFVEQPLPAGPLREARINLLLTLDDPQLQFLPIEAIELLLNEIEEYNDVRLEQSMGRLNKQKQIKKILTLQFCDISTFTQSQIKKLSTTIRMLGDERLNRYLRVFRRMKDFEDFQRENSVWPDFKSMFSFLRFFKKQEEVEGQENQVEDKADRNEEQSFLYKMQRRKGQNSFNFKHD